MADESLVRIASRGLRLIQAFDVLNYRSRNSACPVLPSAAGLRVLWCF
jgi:hypothetical protein